MKKHEEVIVFCRFCNKKSARTTETRRGDRIVKVHFECSSCGEKWSA